MKILTSYPPNINKIRIAFTLRYGVLFCYGDTIYAPDSNGTLPDFLHAHEQVHSDRQGNDPEGWWDRYIEDINFRFNEELLAHRAEWASFISAKVAPTRSKRRLFLRAVAKRLSGKLYGNMITFSKAKRLISENLIQETLTPASNRS